MKKCPNGHDVDDDVKFCPQCGEMIFNTKKRNCVMLILLAAVLCSFFGGVWLFTSNNNNSETIFTNDSLLISEWYNIILKRETVSDTILDKYLSPEVKKKIWTDDYDGFYEVARFRTTNQDFSDIPSSPNLKISIEDGWYIISYDDDGVDGKTKLKVSDNKIADFIQDSSWDLWDSPDDDSHSESSSSDHSSLSDNSIYHEDTSSRKFLNAQYVVGYLAHQSFTNYSDVEIRFDGDGRIYIDGDYAGVVSVLSYNETSALIRYGGGMYDEGRIVVRIEGNKFVLRDHIDGTEWYQK